MADLSARTAHVHLGSSPALSAGTPSLAPLLFLALLSFSFSDELSSSRVLAAPLFTLRTCLPDQPLSSQPVPCYSVVVSLSRITLPVPQPSMYGRLGIRPQRSELPFSPLFGLLSTFFSLCVPDHPTSTLFGSTLLTRAQQAQGAWVHHWKLQPPPPLPPVTLSVIADFKAPSLESVLHTRWFARVTAQQRSQIRRTRRLCALERNLRARRVVCFSLVSCRVVSSSLWLHKHPAPIDLPRPPSDSCLHVQPLSRRCARRRSIKCLRLNTLTMRAWRSLQ
jgi:hypothetical protein